MRQKEGVGGKLSYLLSSKRKLNSRPATGLYFLIISDNRVRANL